jgi:hypothetical protein
MEQLGSHWKDFHEILYFRIFRKSVEDIQVTSDKNNGCFTWRPLYIYDHISAEFLLEREVFQTEVIEKTKNTVCLITFFPSKNLNMWATVEKDGRAGQVIDERHNWPHALPIPDNQGYKHTICSTYLLFTTTTMVTRTRTSYTHIVRLVPFNP